MTENIAQPKYSGNNKPEKTGETEEKSHIVGTMGTGATPWPEGVTEAISKPSEAESKPIVDRTIELPIIVRKIADAFSIKESQLQMDRKQIERIAEFCLIESPQNPMAYFATLKAKIPPNNSERNYAPLYRYIILENKINTLKNEQKAYGN